MVVVVVVVAVEVVVDQGDCLVVDPYPAAAVVVASVASVASVACDACAEDASCVVAMLQVEVGSQRAKASPTSTIGKEVAN